MVQASRRELLSLVLERIKDLRTAIEQSTSPEQKGALQRELDRMLEESKAEYDRLSAILHPCEPYISGTGSIPQ